MNTEQERAELLPCPFCGEAEGLIIQHCEGTIIHPALRIYCDNCGASSGYSDRVDPGDIWNRRAALQHSCKETSQDQEDAERIQFMADEGCTFNTWKQEDGSWKYRLEWDHGTEWQTEWFSTPEEAIDHAISIVGGKDAISMD